MDADLAFCLGQFIDDQVQLIDDRIEAIKQEEIIEYRKIEEEKILFNKRKPIPKNKGSHHEDKALVDQLIQELRNNSSAANNTKTIIDDPACINTLRAELSTKVNASTNYISRLRNIAQPLPNTSKFVQTCNESMNYFRRTQQFEDNFKALTIVLEESDMENVVQNVQKWWNGTYGSQLTDINRRNQKIHQAATENNFAVLSPTTRIIDNAKKLLAARKIIFFEPPKLDIIRKFVQRLLLIDEENRDRINADELIDRLNNSDDEQIIDYAKNWLVKRDEIRNEKEPEDPYDIKLQAAKAEFGRRRIAQEAKKLALAALLCRLAVGSTNGDIKEPEAEELPIIIQLDAGDTDMDQWVANTSGIQERFAAALCQAFHIPDKKIRFDGVERDKCIIYLCILPPYGKNVVDSLNGTAPDAAARMQAVRKCCFDMNAYVESITLGEFGLKIEDRLMDPRWNKKYAWSNSNPDEGQYWVNPINQGGRPYYCPSGWIRFGIKVAEDEKEFDARWGNWYIAYHGTRGEYAANILTSGLKVSTKGCFYQEGIPRVYVSPSIEYCAHPRYAFPWKKTIINGEIRWYQLVFQCRINPESIDRVGPETLIQDEYKQTVKVDPNFDNGELEWIILGKAGEYFIKKDIICYGLMMRMSNVDPVTLTPSAWWKKSYASDIYKKP